MGKSAPSILDALGGSTELNRPSHPASAPSLQVALSGSVRLTRSFEATSRLHGLSAADLRGLRKWTGPRLQWPNRHRTEISLYAAAESAGLWIGGDQNVTNINGFYLPSGMELDVRGYDGPIWVISADETPQLFVIDT